MHKIIHFRLVGLIAVGLILIPLVVFSQIQAEGSVFDHVFLVDTSGSMDGEPLGSENPIIFPKVKKVIKEFLKDIPPEANIFIYPFDEGIHDSKKFEIREEDDIHKAQNYINGLEAKGPNTWIYRSLKNAIDRIADFRKENHVVTIYLYTDGLDTDPTRQYSMKDIMRHFSLERREHDWLYYCTLGVKLSSVEKETLEKSENVTLVETKTGEVPSIYRIETKLPVLDYGNLMETGESVRTEGFVIYNKEDLPSDLNINVRADFPELSSTRVGVVVEPSPFSPKEEIELTLSLRNRESFREEEYGEFEGMFILSTNSPRVFVVPNKVRVKFTYEPEAIVKISPAHGEEFPINFGKLDVFRETTLIAEEEGIVLDYNAQAVMKGGNLKIYTKFSPKNPSLLTSTKNLIINNEKSEYVVISSPEKEVVLKLVADKNLKAGRYEGTLNFESADFTILGEGLESKQDKPGVQFVMWGFTISKPPLPLWKKILFGIIGLLVLCVIGIVVYCAVTGNPIPRPRRKAVVSEGTSLEVRDPKERRGEQINLSGEREVKMGQSGEYFQDANVSFTIKAVREQRKDFMLLSVKSGEVYLKRLREREENAVFEERIFDGDTIRFGNYMVRVSSFSLVRE